MLKIVIVLAIAVGLLGGCAGIADMSGGSTTGTSASPTAGYNPQYLVRAIQDALKLSVTRTTDALSQSGAYENNLAYRIELPESIQGIERTLQQFGLSGPLEKTRATMNSAAELAAAEAKLVMIQAIENLSVNDAIGIVRGGDQAATQYFEQSTRGMLTQRYRAIIQEQLSALSFYASYQQIQSAYKLVPIADKPNLDLEDRVVQKGLDALFARMGEEEKKIRDNPVEQGSLIISTVFAL